MGILGFYKAGFYKAYRPSVRLSYNGNYPPENVLD